MPQRIRRLLLMVGIIFLIIPLQTLASSHSAQAVLSDDVMPPPILYPSVVTGVVPLHQRNLRGNGVTIAVVDSGLAAADLRSDGSSPWTSISTDTLAMVNSNRFIVYKDFVTTTPITNSSDPYGHGTHVVATMADARSTNNPGAGNTTIGIAPRANLVVVRALDEQGQAPYTRMVAAINWVIANKNTFGIDVLNLSIQSNIRAPYWYDQLNQAVMAAWDHGITVVVAAGNEGSDPVSIAAPANVPYVISVGALKPSYYTASGVDELAYYSSAGPTESKFIKPDVLIAGSRVIAPLPENSVLAQSAGFIKEKARLDLGAFRSRTNMNYYALSGTSMAAAEVSGIVALMLEDDPTLTNNQVKYRLMATAQLARDGQGNAAYSVWQQGAGRVNPVAAVDATSTESANVGLNLTLDRDHENGQHYMGLTEYYTTTNTFSYPTPPVAIANYNSWAGSYNSWAGSYNSWAGSYNSWAGSYNSWAGSYNSWAGSYNSWAGSYNSWAGSYNSWAGSYNSWAGSLLCETCTYIPMIQR